MVPEERVRDSTVWERALMVVVERDREIGGFVHAICDNNTNEGNVLRVYVAPDYRAEEIGRWLLEETCHSIFEQGVDRVKWVST